MPAKKKKNNPSTIEELIAPVKEVKEEDPTEDTTPKPEPLVLKSGVTEEQLVNLMLSTNELCGSVISLVSAAAIASGLSATKETLLYCAAALIRAADSFFIMAKLGVEDEINIIDDLVRISDKLAKLPGQGIPAAKAPSMHDWAKKAPPTNSLEEEYLARVKKNKDLN